MTTLTFDHWKGTLIKIRNEAEARKSQLLLEGEGEAAVIEIRALAHAKAIGTIAEAIALPNGREAAKLAIAREVFS
jgi:hypothetical protein